MFEQDELPSEEVLYYFRQNVLEELYLHNPSELAGLRELIEAAERDEISWVRIFFIIKNLHQA
jgi:hypothetical protein